jgi:hypothetical protein
MKRHRSESQLGVIAKGFYHAALAFISFMAAFGLPSSSPAQLALVFGAILLASDHIYRASRSLKQLGDKGG